MLVYLDTSALVKRYVHEPGSGEVLSLFAPGSPSAVSRIAHLEAAGAFARRARSRALRHADLDPLLERLSRDMEECRVVEVTPEVLDRTVRTVRDLPLRAHDALHLSSALWTRDRLDPDVRFTCADRPLARIAGQNGLKPLVPGS
ncbi:MAG: type II toxin-antitoxin system VapC family toxin [Planctomycetes bacterium]|nr:type II toxin-antitoxin system VapC family toxin [Planctomycetota bacterium]